MAIFKEENMKKFIPGRLQVVAILNDVIDDVMEKIDEKKRKTTATQVTHRFHYFR